MRRRNGSKSCIHMSICYFGRSVRQIQPRGLGNEVEYLIPEDSHHVVTSIDQLDDGITPRAELIPVGIYRLQDGFHIRILGTRVPGVCPRPAIDARLCSACLLVADCDTSACSRLTIETLMIRVYKVTTCEDVTVLVIQVSEFPQTLFRTPVHHAPSLNPR